MFTSLPLSKRFTFLQRFVKPEIYPEAYFAYYHRLPNEVQVSWFRDEGMIIGKVRAGDREFVTQGVDADDFLKMVNQSVVTAFNIPDEYFDIVSQTKIYAPTAGDRQLLDDQTITERSFGLMKNEQSFKLA